jgi:hypothetical protein
MRRIWRLQALFLCTLALSACGTDTAETGIFPSATKDPAPAAETRVFILPPAFSPTLTPSIGFTAGSSDTETPSLTPSPSLPITRLPSDTYDPASPPCLNILYPLATGRRWTYSLERGELDDAVVVTVIEAEGNDAIVDLMDEAEGTHSSFLVNCSNGALTDFSITEIGFLFFSTGASLKVSSTSGLLAPSQPQFEEKDWRYAWSTGLTASGEMVLQDLPLGETVMEFEEAPVKIDWESTGETETLQTPAGLFPEARIFAARANFNMTVKINRGAKAQSFPAVLELGAFLWYQPNVGMLKQLFTSGVVIIKGYSYPIAIPSQMELADFDFPP